MFFTALHAAPLLLLPPRQSHILSYPSPVAPASDFVGCCVSWSIGGRLNNDKFCLCLFLPPNSMAKKMQQLGPPSSLPCTPSLLTISYLSGQLLVGCCVSIDWLGAIYGHRLYFFIVFTIVVLKIQKRTKI